MKILRRFLLLSSLAVSALLIFSFFLPASVHVEKTTIINTPANVVFNQINNPDRWPYWMPNAAPGSPFEVAKSNEETNKLAKNTRIIDGVGSITSSEPNKFVNTTLQLNEYGTALQQFKINETDTGTYLTWSVDFHVCSNPISRIYGLFLDQLVSGDITEGLTNLKSLAENPNATSLEMGDMNSQAVKE